MSTSPAFPRLSGSLITKPIQNIRDSLPEIPILDFALASMFFALAGMFLVSTVFAGAVFASEGAVAAVCYVCGVCLDGFDWSCEGEGAGDVREGG